MLFNLFLFIFSCIFLFFLSFFLYKGSNIFELITHSNFNYIYNKINSDTIDIIKKNNKSLNYVVATNPNYIYKTSNITLYIDSIMSEIYFYQNNTLYKLNIYKDKSKLITLFSNLEKKFDYNEFDNQKG